MRGAGRGVFAKIAIKKGEIIERCPIIEIPEGDLAQVNESILVTYFYSFGKKNKRLMIVLGFGSIYNHSYTPNATYKEQYKERLVEFVALRDIKKDEEIMVNYVQGNKKYKHPLWFDV
jgi:SET domain-containing protein